MLNEADGFNDSQPLRATWRGLLEESGLHLDMNLENEHHLTRNAEESFHVVSGDETWDDSQGDFDGSLESYEFDEFSSDYGLDQQDDHYARDELWEAEDSDRPRLSNNDPEHVYVDPHILSTPAIADIDQDGVEELITSVSYFFDRDSYGNTKYKDELNDGIDPSNYVASEYLCIWMLFQFFV